MTARFTVVPPIASAESWPARPAPKAHQKKTSAQIDSDHLDAIFRTNMARRDAAAKTYGEPETPHEFYAGRPGSKAEKIVIDCLRELQAIPEADRLYAHELTDAISAVYLDLAWRAPRHRDDMKIRRRTMALWELFWSYLEPNYS